jgi:hypothetical protein
MGNSLFSAGLRDDGLDFEQGMVPGSGFEDDCACMQQEWEPPTSFFLFDSTALTQQDAPGLKADARNYTVKSRLHWLTVMEEWGWEGKSADQLTSFSWLNCSSNAGLSDQGSSDYLE